MFRLQWLLLNAIFDNHTHTPRQNLQSLDCSKIRLSPFFIYPIEGIFTNAWWNPFVNYDTMEKLLDAKFPWLRSRGSLQRKLKFYSQISIQWIRLRKLMSTLRRLPNVDKSLYIFRRSSNTFSIKFAELEKENADKRRTEWGIICCLSPQ